MTMKHELSEAGASIAKVATIPAVGITAYNLTLQDAVLMLTALSLLIQIFIQVVKLVKLFARGGRDES